MGDGVRVLHVDDDPSFGDLTVTFLEKVDESIEVETETDPTNVVSYLESNPVDCLVCDYDMPGQNGLDVLEAVRRQYPELPFILFTGKGTKEIASQAISSGVTDYIEKQGNRDQFTVLANRILNAVEQYRSEQRFERLVENLPGMVYRSQNTPSWSFEFVSGEVESLTEYTAEELETDAVNWGREILHPEDRDRIWKAVQDQLEADGTFEVTYRLFTKSGVEKEAWERGQLVSVPGEATEMLEGFITDITDQ